VPGGYLPREQMPEHAPPISTANEATRGNIFLDAGTEATWWRSERPGWLGDGARHRGSGLTASSRPGVLQPTAGRRGSAAPEGACSRTGPFTAWQDSAEARSTTPEVRDSTLRRRSAGRRSTAWRRGFLAASILAAGPVMLAPLVYLASRLVAAPGGAIHRPDPVTRAVASTVPRRPLPGSTRLHALPRPVLSTRSRYRWRAAGSHSVRAHLHDHHAAPDDLPAHPDVPRANEPAPATGEPSPPRRAATVDSSASVGRAPTGVGSTNQSGGPSGVAPFGPGYPGAPNG